MAPSKDKDKEPTTPARQPHRSARSPRGAAQQGAPRAGVPPCRCGADAAHDRARRGRGGGQAEGIPMIKRIDRADGARWQVYGRQGGARCTWAPMTPSARRRPQMRSIAPPSERSLGVSYRLAWMQSGRLAPRSSSGSRRSRNASRARGRSTRAVSRTICCRRLATCRWSASGSRTSSAGVTSQPAGIGCDDEHAVRHRVERVHVLRRSAVGRGQPMPSREAPREAHQGVPMAAIDGGDHPAPWRAHAEHPRAGRGPGRDGDASGRGAPSAMGRCRSRTSDHHGPSRSERDDEVRQDAARPDLRLRAGRTQGDAAGAWNERAAMAGRKGGQAAEPARGAQAVQERDRTRRDAERDAAPGSSPFICEPVPDRWRRHLQAVEDPRTRHGDDHGADVRAPQAPDAYEADYGRVAFRMPTARNVVELSVVR